jgi:hypothetical protein
MFIELHKEGRPVLVNTERVLYVSVKSDASHLVATYLIIDDSTTLVVDETCDAVKSIIEATGRVKR